MLEREPAPPGACRLVQSAAPAPSCWLFTLSGERLPASSGVSVFLPRRRSGCTGPACIQAPSHLRICLISLSPLLPSLLNYNLPFPLGEPPETLYHKRLADFRGTGAVAPVPRVRGGKFARPTFPPRFREVGVLHSKLGDHRHGPFPSARHLLVPLKRWESCDDELTLGQGRKIRHESQGPHVLRWRPGGRPRPHPRRRKGTHPDF